MSMIFQSKNIYWILMIYILKAYMSRSKWVFHFYKIVADMDISSSFAILYDNLMASDYLPNRNDPNRYKVHDIQKLEVPLKLIFWNFYKYYEEEVKTIENQWDTRTNAEFYPFIFMIDYWIFLLQHKAGYWDKHSIGIVVNNFISYISNALDSIGIKWGLKKFDIKRDQKDLLNFFFDKTNIINKVEAEQFSFRKFQENKDSKIYTYFNPKASEEDAVTQTEEYFINNTKKITIEWNKNKSLAKVPPVRIAVASAEQISIVEWETQKKQYFYYTPKTRKIECNISEKLQISEILTIASEFLKYFNWDVNSIDFNNNLEDDFIDKWLFEWMDL